jgi:hypothetical protein
MTAYIYSSESSALALALDVTFDNSLRGWPSVGRAGQPTLPVYKESLHWLRASTESLSAMFVVVSAGDILGMQLQFNLERSQMITRWCCRDQMDLDH